MKEDIQIKSVSRIVHNEILKKSKQYKRDLLKDMSKILKKERGSNDKFCKRNQERWKEGFDLLEFLIKICTEIGSNFNQKNRPKAVRENDLIFEVVVKHHARACHIAKEIMCLLKNGFADGALARWRSLHEVTTTMIFIIKHGQDCAEKFLNYDIVESYKGMIGHKKYENRLNEKALSQEEIDECKKRVDELTEKYGKNYKEAYGWVEPFIKNRKFDSIEKDVEMDHMRPYYKWASSEVHSNPKGVGNKLGLSESKKVILLAGPSNSGMVNPAHQTAITLAQATIFLVNSEKGAKFEDVVALTIISDFVDEIGQIFLKISKG